MPNVQNKSKGNKSKNLFEEYFTDIYRNVMHDVKSQQVL